jgi:hypothetical protein
MKLMLLLGTMMLTGCMQPLPSPGPIPPAPDAGAPDIFTEYTADCSSSAVWLERQQAIPWVQGCLDFDGGTDDCMVQGAGHYTKDSIVCAASDLSVKYQRYVDEDVATPMEAANVAHANGWMRKHQIGIRR